MRRYLYIAVFISGMTSLALEMAASRLIGNVFGTSNLVWASIIGLILIYLTVGYFIGGRWADRSPYPKTFYGIMAWGAFTIGVVPILSRPVLRLSANAFDELQFGILIGSFVVVMVLFIVPVILLGTISPFAIRLAIQDAHDAGKLSGRIYAVSTLGSFVGTFLPVLILIPLIGTYRTFLAISAMLLVTALVGLALNGGWKSLRAYIWMPAALVVLAWFGVTGTDKTTAGLIYEGESGYNYIQVLENDGYHVLRLNDGQGVHSIYKPDVYDYNGPWEQVLVAPFFNPAPFDLAKVESMAIVGLAAGTTARQATAVFGPIQIDGYEIDPDIINVGREFFAMDMPNLNAVSEDGRWGLEHSERLYQVISVDAYRPPYIPWHLTTKEFFQAARDHLTNDGVLVINVGRAPEDRRLVDALATTIGEVFASVHVMDLPYSFNSIVYATVQPTRPENLLENYTALVDQAGIHPLLIDAMQTTLTNLQPTPEQTIVFTDDHAPIEWITNNMVLSYILSGDVEELQ